MKVYYPPDNTTGVTGATLFLAGSIDMGKAPNWHEEFLEKFEKKCTDDEYFNSVSVFNPRRDDWDSSWKQEFKDSQFSQQVMWEQLNMKKARTVFFNFLPNSQSPITLMELGIMSEKAPGRCMVLCPEGFWRKGNVDIICYLKNIRMVESLDEAIAIYAHSYAI